MIMLAEQQSTKPDTAMNFVAHSLVSPESFPEIPKTRIVHYALFSYILALSSMQLLTIALCLARVTITQPLALLIIACGIMAGLICFRPALNQLKPLVRPGRLKNRLAIPLVLLGFLNILLCFVSFNNPYLGADCAMYHLPTIHYWSKAGRVYWIENSPNMPYFVDSFMNGYSKGVELIGFLILKATSCPRLVNLINLYFLPLGTLGIACMAIEIGAAPLMALIAGFIFPLVPTIIAQSRSTYVDAGYASCVIAFLACVAIALPVMLRGERFSWRLTFGLGSALGLALAAKGSGVIVVAVGCGSLFVFSVAKSIAGKDITILRRQACWLALCVLIASLVGGYWYARNFAIKSNPLYPVELKVLGHVVFPGIPMANALAINGNTPAEIRDFSALHKIWTTWTQSPKIWPDSIHSVASRLGGLGFIWFLGSIPAIVILSICGMLGLGPVPRRVPFFMLFLITAMMFAGTPMNWWARYTAWVQGFGLAAFACVLSKLMANSRNNSRGRAFWVVGRIWLVMGMIIIMVESMTSLALADRDGNYASTGGWDYVAQSIPTVSRLATKTKPLSILLWPPNDITKDILKSKDPIGFGPMTIRGETSIYVREAFGCLCDGSRDLCLLRITPNSGEQDAKTIIETRRIRYIFWDSKNAKIPNEILRMATRVENKGNLLTLELSVEK